MSAPEADPNETEYDFAGKYENRGRVARHLIDGFFSGVQSLLAMAEPQRVLEVGCGEGFSTRRLRGMLGPRTHLEASDIEQRLVTAARARNPGVTVRRESAYELEREPRSFDLVVCMEVLEHLEDPARAMEELCRVSARWLVLSVPREPLWRALNLARLHYVRDLGNTPGHLQHWSRRSFETFVRRWATPVAVLTPVPWTQVLARVSPD
jgi:2-polyprenyl-3-methyl-5-hydroxy-6-metoxy-1,4-benzoquinol methylase